MDIVFINSLTIETVIGCLNWERKIRQRVILDIEMAVDCQKAAQTDNVVDALNYAAVSQRVVSFVQDSSFKLVETLAERVAEIILAEFTCQHVKIRLKKPGAIPEAQTVGVIIERLKTKP